MSGLLGNRTWRRWDDIADVFDGVVDVAWESDRQLVDNSVVSPWKDPTG